MSVPGIGPVIEALAPPLETFRSSRDFAASIELTPLQHSTGGKERLGRTSCMGKRTLCRLLIIASSAVLRWTKRKGVPASSWWTACWRKPPMLVIVALANKNARIA